MAAEEVYLYDLNTDKSSAWATLCQSGDCYLFPSLWCLCFSTLYFASLTIYLLAVFVIVHVLCVPFSCIFPRFVYDFWVPFLFFVVSLFLVYWSLP